MEQHTQKAWMARSLWTISEYLVFRSLQHGLTQSCWRPEAPAPAPPAQPPPPPEATGATSLSSWPGCSRKPSLVKLWMILDEDWIVHLAGRWPATQSQECSAHIEIRSLGLTWVFFFLQGVDGNDRNFDGNWVLPDQQRRNIPDCLFSVLFLFHQLFVSPSPPHNGWAAHRAPGVPADQGLEKAHLEKYLQKLRV